MRWVRLTGSLVLAVLAAACHHRQPVTLAPVAAVHCRESAGPLTWVGSGSDPRLEAWCAQVGSPVVVPVQPDPAVAPRAIVVLSWNVHVGGGRVMDVVDWIRKKAEAEAGPVGFVLLLQETYRQGGDIPRYAAGTPVPGAIRPVRPTPDVAALGRYLNMSVAYVPSMRNGKGDDGPLEREDRGCAVLTTEKMSDVHAIELPFGKQRRVAVMATITPRGMLPAMRVMSAHFDTGFIGVKHQRRQAEALAAHLIELAAHTSPPLLMGIDANVKHGTSDYVIKQLQRAIPLVESCDTRPTMPFLLRFDFLFSTLDPSRLRACETLPHKYGSDHKPKVLRIANP